MEKPLPAVNASLMLLLIHYEMVSNYFSKEEGCRDYDRGGIYDCEGIYDCGGIFILERQAGIVV